MSVSSLPCLNEKLSSTFIQTVLSPQPSIPGQKILPGIKTKSYRAWKLADIPPGIQHVAFSIVDCLKFWYVDGSTGFSQWSNNNSRQRGHRVLPSMKKTHTVPCHFPVSANAGHLVFTPVYLLQLSVKNQAIIYFYKNFRAFLQLKARIKPIIYFCISFLIFIIRLDTCSFYGLDFGFSQT